MDTRSKIITVDEALRLTPPVTVVAGSFDVLRASHIRDLDGARLEREAALLVVVVPALGECLPQAARAELAAALRMVDYVVTADAETAGRLGQVLMCSPIVRLSAPDASRARDLKEHVRRRQR